MPISLFIFFKKLWLHQSLCGATDTLVLVLLVTSALSFKAMVGSLAYVLHHLCTMDSSNSTSW